MSINSVIIIFIVKRTSQFDGIKSIPDYILNMYYPNSSVFITNITANNLNSYYLHFTLSLKIDHRSFKLFQKVTSLTESTYRFLFVIKWFVT